MCTSVNAPLWTLQFKGGRRLSKGASRRAKGLLELLEVVSAGFWCQEHVLRFRGKSSPQTPAAAFPARSPRSTTPTPVTPAPDSSRRRVEVTKKRNKNKKKEKNSKGEKKRKKERRIPTSNARNNRDRARGVKLEKKKKGTIENARR